MAYSFISNVEMILDQHAIYYMDSIEPDHISICTDQMMKDPGFAYDNKLLDLFIDKKHHILFIGLLRLPTSFRRQRIGLSIIAQLDSWAKENGYSMFLDSCEDSVPFWRKCGFQTICYRDGFYVMGLGDSDLKSKWIYGQRLFQEIHGESMILDVS
jgi:GNAT superfamily N-acetyltransferase